MQEKSLFNSPSRLLIPFCFYIKFYSVAEKTKTLLLVCPFESSMNPAEMPATSENHNNIDGAGKLSKTVILSAHYVCA